MKITLDKVSFGFTVFPGRVEFYCTFLVYPDQGGKVTITGYSDKNYIKAFEDALDNLQHSEACYS